MFAHKSEVKRSSDRTPFHSSGVFMYGWSKRIELIVPSSNKTCEMEFHKLIPQGVSVHVSRVFIPEDKSPGERIQSIVRMGGELLGGGGFFEAIDLGIDVVWARLWGQPYNLAIHGVA